MNNITQPLFQKILGHSWHTMPPVMQKHYAVRENSGDRVTVKGTLDITVKPYVRFLAKWTKMLVPYSGNNISVTVHFYTEANEPVFHFERIFHFPEHGDIVFHSRLKHIKDNILIEQMRFGLAWKSAYIWDGRKMILEHRGYVWKLAHWLIPIPLALLLGKGAAEEYPISDTRFSMWTHTKHPLFGKPFAYHGEFEVTEIML